MLERYSLAVAYRVVSRWILRISGVRRVMIPSTVKKPIMNNGTLMYSMGPEPIYLCKANKIGSSGLSNLDGES